MRLIPVKFMPVQLAAKDVTSWEELERERAKHAPVLGLDDWYEVGKYCAADLIFCGIVSKAFVWVLISGAAIIYFKDEKSALLAYNFIGSLLHFAAKDEFKKVVGALCSRWAGASDVVRGPVTTTVTNNAEVKKL